MTEIGAIPKRGRNDSQGYAFRGIDDVMAAVQPVFSKHGVLVLPSVQEMRTESIDRGQGKAAMQVVRLLIDYKFIGPEGDHISATVVGEGMDTGDKASNKAMSAGFKYALCQALCIPTEEIAENDADRTSPDTSGGTSDEVPPGGFAVKDGHKESHILSSTEPACPSCGGVMYDNRDGKQKPTQPDWKCKKAKWNAAAKKWDGCDGMYWLAS